MYTVPEQGAFQQRLALGLEVLLLMHPLIVCMRYAREDDLSHLKPSLSVLLCDGDCYIRTVRNCDFIISILDCQM